MLPIEVRTIIEHFKVSDGYLALPGGCENMCGTITFVLTRRFAHHNMRSGLEWARCRAAVDVTRVGREQHLSQWHIAPVWDGTVIDFTARQFWPTTDWPLIEPVQDYRRRFAQVNLTDPRWEDVCTGPSRIARRDKMRRLVGS